MARETKPKTKPRETARHLEAFESWYEAKRSFRQISPELAVPQRTLFGWAENFNWHQRADERDRAAQSIVDSRAIQDRAKRIEDQRRAGSLLRTRGVEYLAENKISDERAAIGAIKTGTDIERQADGLPDYIVAIMNLSPDAKDEISAEFERRVNERRGIDADDVDGESAE